MKSEGLSLYSGQGTQCHLTFVRVPGKFILIDNIHAKLEKFRSPSLHLAKEDILRERLP